MSDIATVRMELGEDSRRRLIADMSAIVEERDELLLAVADYVLETNSLEAAEKAEKVQELMEKVRGMTASAHGKKGRRMLRREQDEHLLDAYVAMENGVGDNKARQAMREVILNPRRSEARTAR